MAKEMKQFELNLRAGTKNLERDGTDGADQQRPRRAILESVGRGRSSNYHAAQSGHLYFTLKDAKAQVKCVCFRTQAMRRKFRPETE